jgi:hypothetical protein
VEFPGRGYAQAGDLAVIVSTPIRRILSIGEIAISNNVGDVKQHACTRLPALVEERHFVLVDG